jgi:plastocyanin
MTYDRSVVRGEAKPQRALGFALLVLAAVVAVPAFSVAQDPAPVEPPAAELPPAPTQPPEPPAPPHKADKADSAPEPETKAPAEPTPPPEAVSAAAAEPTVAAPASTQAKAKAAASATVSTGDNFFSPTSVSIFAGETVTWRNNGNAQHSATANDGSFDTGVFGPGASRSETFSSPGTYAYYCVVHGLSQSGTVRVASAGGNGGGGNGGGGGSAASDATSGNSEAAAVAAPDAAGTGTSLPATGFAVLGLGGTGVLLLISGMVAERRAGRRSPGRWFSIY